MEMVAKETTMEVFSRLACNIVSFKHLSLARRKVGRLNCWAFSPQRLKLGLSSPRDQKKNQHIRPPNSDLASSQFCAFALIYFEFIFGDRNHVYLKGTLPGIRSFD